MGIERRAAITLLLGIFLGAFVGTFLLLAADKLWRDPTLSPLIFDIPIQGWRVEDVVQVNITEVRLSTSRSNGSRRESQRESATVAEPLPCTASEERRESANSGRVANTTEKPDLETHKAEDPAARLLYEQWKYLYISSANTTLSESERNISMSDVGLHKSIPYAPHLQDCAAVDARRRKEEEVVGGNYPDWVGINVNGSNQPQPPWIRGGIQDNVPLTHVAQRDIWLQQHPPNCRDPSVKFAMLEWTQQNGHGLGSQLHILSTNIGKVLTAGRVIVAGPWQRAMHDGCQGEDHGRFECYFLGMTSPECLQVFYEELKKTDGKNIPTDFSSPARIVRFGPWMGLNLPSSLLQKWGGAAKWIQENPTTEIGGKLTKLGDGQMYAKWWHAQTTAYMMRWPSVRLCRLINKARHDVYGMEVAEMVIAAQNARKNLNVGQPLFAADVIQKPNVSLDMDVWQKDEPYIPRPLLSMHVRQGDKAREMQIFQLRDIMWSAERLRLKVPDLHHVWLSTEMQTVLEESKEYTPRWHFMYTDTHRMVGTKSNYVYELESGVKADLENSLVNLMIASEADYFVGTLGSNWNRLLDEFRKTRGRNRRGYISLNDGEARR